MWLSSPGFERALLGHGLNNGVMTLPDQALAQYFWPALEPHTSAVGSGLGSSASAPSFLAFRGVLPSDRPNDIGGHFAP